MTNHMKNQVSIRMEDIVWRNKDGDIHREDGPAIISEDGSRKEWWRNGYRDNPDGYAVWRNDGNHLEWWVKGQRHRDGAPAVITAGKHFWWVNGVMINTPLKEFAALHSIDLRNLTDEDKILIAIYFGN